jgi:hypothetical protein
VYAYRALLVILGFRAKQFVTVPNMEFPAIPPIDPVPEFVPVISHEA